jgi:hypothetical protein
MSVTESARWVDKDEIKTAVEGREREVLRALNIPWNGRGHILCPYPTHDDHDPSWRWDDKDHAAHCTCDKHHSIFDVVMKKLGLQFDEAKLFVAEAIGRSDLIHGGGRKRPADGPKPKKTKTHGIKEGHEIDFDNPEAVFSYHDTVGIVIYQNVRLRLLDKDGNLVMSSKGKPDKTFRQRRPNGNGGWKWGIGDIKAVPYLLPDIIKDDPDLGMFFVEGEAKANLVRRMGFPATSIQEGCKDFGKHFAGRCCWILPDKDKHGEERARFVAEGLRGHASEIYRVDLPGLREKDDVVDWINERLKAGKTGPEIIEEFKAVPETPWVFPPLEPPPPDDDDLPSGAVLSRDFYAFMPTHQYLYVPARNLWSPASINGRFGKKSGDRLDQTKPIEQMTWAPGFPELICDRLILEGGWRHRDGVKVFNLYLPPNIEPGDPKGAQFWLDHLRRVYPEHADHIIAYFAHCRQFPHIKRNHALVLGGPQGIGKDTILEPLKFAVGPWNFADISPQEAMGQHTGFLKSIVLRISEARDRGGAFARFDRYDFYEHTKTFITSPPDVHRVNEKYIPQHYIQNVNAVIITTNHKNDGIYLPEDDRRHFVAWSPCKKEEFTPAYWKGIWGRYHEGGIADIVAYLDAYDLSGFDPKAAPPQTAAFWEIVTVNKPIEDAEFGDALHAVGHAMATMNEVLATNEPILPDAVTLNQIRDVADGTFREWLDDRKNRRSIPHRLERAKYVQVLHPTADQGLWTINRKRQAIYARTELTAKERLDAAWKLVGRLDAKRMMGG